MKKLDAILADDVHQLFFQKELLTCCILLANYSHLTGTLLTTST